MDAAAIRDRFETAVREHEPVFGKFFLARFFGMEVSYDEQAETCTVRMPHDPFLNNPQGSLHGGVVVSALDVSMGHLCQRFVRTCVTLEMKTQFLRPVLGPSRCEAAFVKKGRRIVFTESRMFGGEDRLCAIATATWMPVQEASE